MRDLTLKNHPDCTAVLRMKPGMGAAACAAWAREQLDDPRYNSAVVFLSKRSIKHDFSAAADAFRQGADILYALVNPDDFLVPEQAVKRMSDVNIQHSPDDICEIFGPDFDLLKNICLALGPTELHVRASDGDNALPHIDRSEILTNFFPSFRDVAAKPDVIGSQIPGGISVTMADHGGGSYIIDVPVEHFRRVTGCAGKEIWMWKQEVFSDDVWRVQNRTIAFLRAQNWDEKHPPCLHQSPVRKNNGNPDERIAGVGFVYKYI